MAHKILKRKILRFVQKVGHLDGDHEENYRINDYGVINKRMEVGKWSFSCGVVSLKQKWPSTVRPS